MARKRPVTAWENSAFLNTQTYNFWYMRFKELCINRFHWVNMPSEIDERFLELTLFDKGYALFFKDEIAQLYIALTCMISGEWDIYNIPKERIAYASNDYQYYCDFTDSVIIFNNYMHTTDVLTCQYYAHKMYEVERTIDVNVKGQKTPLFISTTEQQRLTMVNLYEKYEGNEPLIIGDKRLDPSALQVMMTPVPYVADKLQILKHQYFNEFLTAVGIENSNEDKRERLVANEVASNYGVVEASRNIPLQARKQACKQINEMFGLNIDVEFNSHLQTLVNQAFKPELGNAITIGNTGPAPIEEG